MFNNEDPTKPKDTPIAKYISPLRRRGGTFIENIYFDDKRLDIYDKVILLYLHRFAGEHPEGKAWPKEVALAQRTGMSERRARESLSKLKELGYIRVDRSNVGARNVYEVVHQNINDKDLW